MWINGLLIASALLLSGLGVFVFVYMARKGEFEDVEEAKFTMLRAEDEDAGRP